MSHLTRKSSEGDSTIATVFTRQEEAIIRRVFGSHWNPRTQSDARTGTLYLDSLRDIGSHAKRFDLSPEHIRLWSTIRLQYEKTIRPLIRDAVKNLSVPNVSQLISELQPVAENIGAEETDDTMVIILAVLYRCYLDAKRSPQQDHVLYFRGSVYRLEMLDINNLVSMGDCEEETGSDIEYRLDWNALYKALSLSPNHARKEERCDVM